MKPKTFVFTCRENEYLSNKDTGGNTPGSGSGYATTTTNKQYMGQEDDRILRPSANPPPCTRQGSYKCVLPTYRNKDIYNRSMYQKVTFSNIVQVQTDEIYNKLEPKPCRRPANHKDMIHIEEEDSNYSNHKHNNRAKVKEQGSS